MSSADQHLASPRTEHRQPTRLQSTAATLHQTITIATLAHRLGAQFARLQAAVYVLHS